MEGFSGTTIYNLGDTHVESEKRCAGLTLFGLLLDVLLAIGTKAEVDCIVGEPNRMGVLPTISLISLGRGSTAMRWMVTFSVLATSN